MFDGVALEKEQIELLALLAEAVRVVPPDKRAKFLFVETFGGALQAVCNGGQLDSTSSRSARPALKSWSNGIFEGGTPPRDWR